MTFVIPRYQWLLGRLVEKLTNPDEWSPRPNHLVG